MNFLKNIFIKIISAFIINTDKRHLFKDILEYHFFHKDKNKYLQCKFYYNFISTHKLNKEKYNLISLGEDCFVRKKLRYSSFIKSRKQGYKSCVFDLINSSPTNIVHFLETNFEDFFDDLYFDDKKLNRWRSAKHKLLFRHDINIKSKEELIEKYKKKIKNFYDILDNPKILFLVRKIKGNFPPEHLDRIYNVIKKIRNDKPFQIIFCNLNNKKIEIKNKNIAYFTIDCDKDFIWHKVDKDLNLKKYFEVDYQFLDNVYKIIKSKIK